MVIDVESFRVFRSEGEVLRIPKGLVACGGEFVEGFDFGGGEEESTCGGGFFTEVGFRLAGKEAMFVAVAEDIVEDGFEVFGLGPVLGEGAVGEGVGVDDLEVEGGGSFLTGRGFFGA